jgi:hypothetical protein
LHLQSKVYLIYAVILYGFILTIRSDFFFEEINSIDIDSYVRDANSVSQGIANACGKPILTTVDAMTASIVGIEFMERGTLEPAGEKMFSALARVGVLNVDNYSLGVAQIRPNTLVEYGIIERIDKNEAWHLEFDDCYSYEMARLLVQKIEEKCPPDFDLETCFLSVYIEYNGQMSMSSSNYAALTVARAAFFKYIEKRGWQLQVRRTQ